MRHRCCQQEAKGGGRLTQIHSQVQTAI
jgi:hypothetical protein